MNYLTTADLNSKYLIYKNLTPTKEYKTYLAMKDSADGYPYPVILKEMDEKRAAIYQQLSAMWNPFTADVYDVFFLSDDNTHGRYLAVTEYICTDSSSSETEHLSLSQFIHRHGPLKQSAALSVCIQLCDGLKDFHRKGFVHRDLKPDNIMMCCCNANYPQVKIIDFGGAKQDIFEHNMDTTVVGTLGYQAPESISSRTTARSDIYSIGCILHFLLTGYEPGILPYKGHPCISRIIEKATATDPYFRYANVTALQKDIEHELRLRLLDKVPVVRSIPGFRTHTLWKEITASIFYINMFVFEFICTTSFDIGLAAEVFIFYVILPLIIIFNMGNLLRFFPEKLRCNNQLFLLIRMALVLSSVVLPMVIENLMR